MVFDNYPIILTPKDESLCLKESMRPKQRIDGKKRRKRIKKKRFIT
jgi:hypothetical protein